MKVSDGSLQERRERNERAVKYLAEKQYNRQIRKEARGTAITILCIGAAGFLMGLVSGLAIGAF